MKTTTPGSMGGTKVAIACPNMWLSGSRLRKRSGKNGVPHLRYLSTSRSTGTMFASTLRWVMMTPFGSAVAPDVKMISATSSRVMATCGARTVGPLELLQLPDRCTARVTDRRNVLSDEHQPRLDDSADPREKVGRRAVVDRHDDRADQETAPEGDDPLGSVLGKEDNRVALAETGRMQPGREAARGASHLLIAEPPLAEAVVVDEEVAPGASDVVEEVDERVARHG